MTGKASYSPKMKEPVTHRDERWVLTAGEFDGGSGRTLAAWIRHASRAQACLRVLLAGRC